MRILITGADGFVGRHAARAFRERGDEVVVGVGPGGDAAGGFEIDVTRPDSIARAIEQSRPQAILHLAGASSVARSHEDPVEAVAVNTLGVASLLAAMRRLCSEARLVLVSSGEVYGRVSGDALATEATPLAPRSPYAASKAAGELLAFQFALGYGLAIVVARPFNHIGAGQAPGFVVPSFAAQIARIAQGGGDPVLRVGDLTPIRDFSHVLDVVEGYRLLIESGVPGEAYNVASGLGRTVGSLVDELGELAGVAVRTEVDESKLRPAEIVSLVGDATKLRRLGWAPTRGARAALSDALDEARGRLAGAS